MIWPAGRRIVSLDLKITRGPPSVCRRDVPSSINGAGPASDGKFRAQFPFEKSSCVNKFILLNLCCAGLIHLGAGRKKERAGNKSERMDPNKQTTNKQTKSLASHKVLPSNKKASSPKTLPVREVLRNRLAAIEKIQYQSHAHPLFKQWDRENRRFLEESLGRPYLERYRLILFSEPKENGFVFRKSSVSWQDKEYYQRGLQRAKVFFKSMLWELKETSVKAKT